MAKATNIRSANRLDRSNTLRARSITVDGLMFQDRVGPQVEQLPQLYNEDVVEIFKKFHVRNPDQPKRGNEQHGREWQCACRRWHRVLFEKNMPLKELPGLACPLCGDMPIEAAHLMEKLNG